MIFLNSVARHCSSIIIMNLNVIAKRKIVSDLCLFFAIVATVTVVIGVKVGEGGGRGVDAVVTLLLYLFS